MESGKMAAIDSPGSRRAHSKYFMFLLDTESGEATAGKRAADERRWLRRREKNASIAGLTDESVCPTLVLKGLRFCGAGAFACQPILSQLLTVAARIGNLVYSLHGEENRSAGAHGGGDFWAGGVCGDGGCGDARRGDCVRLAGADGGDAGDHNDWFGIFSGAARGDPGVALVEARRAPCGLPAGGGKRQRGSGGATAQGADSQTAAGSFLWPGGRGNAQLPERARVCAGGIFWDPGRYLRGGTAVERGAGVDGGGAGILTGVSGLPLSERRGGGLGAGGGVAGAVAYCGRSPRGFPCLISS